MSKLTFRNTGITLILVAFLLVSFIPKAFSQKAKSPKTDKIRPVDLVNPLTDSHKSRWFYFNSACRPFGMVQLSPDTWVKGNWMSGYLYDSLQVRCFSHIHDWEMSGIPVMPTTGEFKGHLGMEAYKSAFSHEEEIVKPGYHKVVLKNYGITAELTSTMRVGFHRYTFPQSQKSYILFDTGALLGQGGVVESEVRLVNDSLIVGKSLMAGTVRRPKDTWVYFAAKVNRDIDKFSGWTNKTLVTEKTDLISGKNAGAFIQFSTKPNEQVLMKVAIAYTSIDQAIKNMNTELAHWDFDRVVKESLDEWNTSLSRIEVEGGTKAQQIKFYTDVWHSLIGRHVVSDVDGKYCDMTGDKPVIRQVELDSEGQPKFPHHNFDGFWGSHWSLNLFWSLAYPEAMDAMVNSMLNMYQHGGLIPRGPSGGNYTYVMIGCSSTPLVVAAYNKGIRNYNVEMAYEGIKKNTTINGIRIRNGYDHSKSPKTDQMKFYLDKGYVAYGLPSDGYHKDATTSMTLEFAYQDWCVGQMAKLLGKTDDYELFNKRGQNYKNVYDPGVGYVRARLADGSWLPDFKPVDEGVFESPGFCEGSPAVCTNYVPQDPAGLIALKGGNEQYTKFLNEIFEKGKKMEFVVPHGKHAGAWVDYENQESTGMAHMFNHSGAPWLTQKWVREIYQAVFSEATPYGGYRGDEDQGQMGSLSAMLAMGFFDERGGSAVKPVYEITTPVFDKTTIHLNNKYYNGDFVIETIHNSPENIYIQSATLNGKPLDNCWFYHDDIVKGGGKLVLKLGNTPNKNWGTKVPPPSN